MILADTSAWIDLQRSNQRAGGTHLERLLPRDADVAVTEPVIMELLAGCRTDGEVAATRRRLLGLTLARVGGLDTYERAAAVQRACLRAGEPVRSAIDCLIAAVAIVHDASLLHSDRDFDPFAQHLGLRVVESGGNK